MKKIVIVGGVAGGASCAARLRRQDESAQITMFEKGPYVSFANCGLPYYIGNVIKQEDDLLIADTQLFEERFRIDARVLHEVQSIDREKKTVTVCDLKSGETFDESYDQLVLSPGASPIRPPPCRESIPREYSPFVRYPTATSSRGGLKCTMSTAQL